MQNLINNRRSDLLEEYEQEFESFNKLAKRKLSFSDSSDDDDSQNFSNNKSSTKLFRENFQNGFKFIYFFY